MDRVTTNVTAEEEGAQELRVGSFNTRDQGTPLSPSAAESQVKGVGVDPDPSEIFHEALDEAREENLHQ